MTYPLKKLQDFVYLCNKPVGISSFGFIKKLKQQLKVCKIGHAGTLDPLASGLMIIGVDKGTKLLTDFIKQDKEYTGVICLGACTASYDLETIPEFFKDFSKITPEQIQQVCNTFKGDISQIPPMFSALKKNGQPLYKLARQGIALERAPRQVHIESLQITQIAFPKLYFKVHCSSGTYIRCLAHDIGEQLGVGGYLKELVRTKIGNDSFEIINVS